MAGGNNAFRDLETAQAVWKHFHSCYSYSWLQHTYGYIQTYVNRTCSSSTSQKSTFPSLLKHIVMLVKVAAVAYSQRTLSCQLWHPSSQSSYAECVYIQTDSQYTKMVLVFEMGFGLPSRESQRQAVHRLRRLEPSQVHWFINANVPISLGSSSCAETIASSISWHMTICRSSAPFILFI